MTHARRLGMTGEEIIAVNRSRDEAAKKVRDLYNDLLRDLDDSAMQKAFLDALLVWRDSVVAGEK